MRSNSEENNNHNYSLSKEVELNKYNPNDIAIPIVPKSEKKNEKSKVMMFNYDLDDFKR